MGDIDSDAVEAVLILCVQVGKIIAGDWMLNVGVVLKSMGFCRFEGEARIIFVDVLRWFTSASILALA